MDSAHNTTCGKEIKILETSEKTRFNNKNCYCDNMRFDSIKECRRYCQLKMLEKGKYITDLKRQVPYVLQEEFVFNGKKEHAIMYYADFDYFDKRGNHIVEDVKGSKRTLTQEYLMKAKMFKFRYGIAITEVYDV